MPKTLKRSWWQRLMGLPVTGKPADPTSWRIEGDTVEVDLDRTPELLLTGSGVRLEGKGLPYPILLVHGDDGEFYGYRNQCSHLGRRLDPIPGAGTLQCCSLGHSTYNYQGEPLHGPAKYPLRQLDTDRSGNTVRMILAP